MQGFNRPVPVTFHSTVRRRLYWIHVQVVLQLFHLSNEATWPGGLAIRLSYSVKNSSASW